MDSNLTPIPNPVAPPPPPPNPGLLMGQPSGLMESGQPGQPPTQFQQTLINRLMDMLPFQNQGQPSPSPAPEVQASPASSTSSDRPSSTPSTRGEGQGAREEGKGAKGEIAPDLDDEGFPKNDDYLKEQGLTLSELNRAYLQQQEQSQQATDFITALTQADPQQAMQMIQEFQNTYNQEMQNQGFNGAQPPQEAYQRPNFPGGAPNQQQYATPDQLFQQAVQMGNPLDQLEAVHGLWNQIPEDYIRSLAPYLIRES